VDAYSRSQGRRYGIIREYGGHGIGTSMHMPPMVFNYPVRGEQLVLSVGMAIAIEPMLTLGKHKTRLMPDDWTVTTRDGSYAAHWEHTVAITPDGVVVTTAAED
jgi:methionyl aminopeptidase